ncbi:cytochrome C [Amylibacter kogurei]|uniref:Cytochrome C n=1 Tax=Paramylibacter kogurei TaxID=1889778 RepID=A0A2G5K5B5_9RHOB|nr:cytochrome C [Amylibacter kogurei]
MRMIITVTGIVFAVLIAVLMLTNQPPQNAPDQQQTAQMQIPTLTGAAVMGKTFFDAKCALCHGANASGTENGPPLVHIIYEPNHHGDESFLRAASQGVRAHHWQFGDMPPVEGITQGEVKQIIAYVRSLQRANGIY